MSYILQWIVVVAVVVISTVYLIRRLSKHECACPYADQCGKSDCSKDAKKCKELNI